MVQALRVGLCKFSVFTRISPVLQYFANLGVHDWKKGIFSQLLALSSLVTSWSAVFVRRTWKERRLWDTFSRLLPGDRNDVATRWAGITLRLPGGCCVFLSSHARA